MDIKPYGHQLRPERVPEPCPGDPQRQRRQAERLVSAGQPLQSGADRQAQQALTYEHLARNGKNTVLTGGVKDARVQQMVDKALGFDRKNLTISSVSSRGQRMTRRSRRGARNAEQDLSAAAMPCLGGHGSPHRQIRLPGVM